MTEQELQEKVDAEVKKQVSAMGYGHLLEDKGALKEAIREVMTEQADEAAKAKAHDEELDRLANEIM